VTELLSALRDSDLAGWEEAIERGRLLFAQTCDFMISAVAQEQLPPPSRPEVAFAGRSNVGKSSLVNALTGRKTLAKTSGTPGRTRQLNVFDLAGRLYLVDLPGYGYARAPKSEIAVWQGLTLDYLKGRPNLRRVLLLIDARHGIKAPDREVMDLLDRAAVSYQLVLTKADKLKPAERERQVAAVEQGARGRTAAYPEVLLTSASKGEGVPLLRASIAQLLDA